MALSFCQMPRKVILHQYGQHHCPSLVPCETWTSLSAKDCYLGLPQMFLPPSLSTHCLTHSEAKHVPREQLRRETSVLLGNAVILKKNLKIFLSGRAGWAAGLWGGSKKERKLQGIVHLLLLVPKSLPRLPQAAGPQSHGQPAVNSSAMPIVSHISVNHHCNPLLCYIFNNCSKIMLKMSYLLPAAR